MRIIACRIPPNPCGPSSKKAGCCFYGRSTAPHHTSFLCEQEPGPIGRWASPSHGLGWQDPCALSCHSCRWCQCRAPKHGRCLVPAGIVTVQPTSVHTLPQKPGLTHPPRFPPRSKHIYPHNTQVNNRFDCTLVLRAKSHVPGSSSQHSTVLRVGGSFY